MKKELEVGRRLNIFILLFLIMLTVTYSKVKTKIQTNTQEFKVEYTKTHSNIQTSLTKQRVLEVKKLEKPPYTEEEVDLLARLMYAEVGVFLKTLPEEEAKEAHMLTGSVVLNRVKMNFSGATTIKEVIYAPGQYQCVTNGSINKKPPEILYEWAEDLLANGTYGPDNMVYQSQFKQGTVYKKIGNQYFCCRKR